MNMSMNPAFEVKIDPTFDPEDTPMTGEQYLQKVIFERQKCPDVVTVPLDEKKLKTQVPYVPIMIEKPPCPSHLVPTKEWQEYQIKTFSKLRNRIQHILDQEDYEMNEKSEYLLEILEKSRESPEGATELFVKLKPFVEVVTLITQNLWWKLIKKQIQLLNTFAESLTSSGDYEKVESECLIANSDTEGTLSWIGPWIYAGLLCIKTPLEPEMHDQLRKLVMALAEVRTRLKDSTFMNTTPLAIPICIVSKFFEQYDLSD